MRILLATSVLLLNISLLGSISVAAGGNAQAKCDTVIKKYRDRANDISKSLNDEIRSAEAAYQNGTSVCARAKEYSGNDEDVCVAQKNAGKEASRGYEKSAKSFCDGFNQINIMSLRLNKAEGSSKDPNCKAKMREARKALDKMTIGNKKRSEFNEKHCMAAEFSGGRFRIQECREFYDCSEKFEKPKTFQRPRRPAPKLPPRRPIPGDLPNSPPVSEGTPLS